MAKALPPIVLYTPFSWFGRTLAGLSLPTCDGDRSSRCRVRPARLRPIRSAPPHAGDAGPHSRRSPHQPSGDTLGLGIYRMILFGYSVCGAMAIVAAADIAATAVAVITESAQVFAEERTLSPPSARRTRLSPLPTNSNGLRVPRDQGLLGPRCVDRDLACACLRELDARRRPSAAALPTVARHALETR